MGTIKSKHIYKKYLFWILPVCAVLLSAVLLQSLLWRKQTEFREIAPVNGILDITELDLSTEVFNIANCWDFYPEKLYFSEDFKSGNTNKKAETDKSATDVSYGTYRLLIRAKPDQYYTICSFSIDYATRVFANGAEIALFGNPADNAEDSIPKVGYMTLPLFSGEDGEIEIIYQYSNYVHREGGFIQPTYISTPQNMENFKAGNNLVSLSVSGGLLFLMLYFMLSAAVQRKADFLCLALCCLVMALRDQNFYNIHLLSPDFSWYIMYRIFIFVVMLLPASVLFLLKSIYSKATKQWPLYIYLGIVFLSTILIFVLPTKYISLVSAAIYYTSIPYLLYLLTGVVLYYYKTHRRLDMSDVLTLLGFFIMLGTLLYEAFLTGRSSEITHYGFAAFGTLGFILLTAIAISLRIQARETALAESHSRGEMLEKINRMNMDFLHKVAHELKTPLTVISGYAQLTGMQLASDNLSSETPENLKTIQQEAQRLADMVTRLMEYSYGRERELKFTRIRVEELLDNVRAIASPMCLKNNNTVITIYHDCPDIHGNFEMLLQVFINLVVNANKHTINGKISIDTSETEDDKYILFKVSDTGSGISAEDIPHIFEQGYSPDGSNGLGLAICREAIEAHGGKIQLEKTGPDGTTFSFTVLQEEGNT